MKLQHLNIFDETIKHLNRSLILILSTIYEIGIYTCVYMWNISGKDEKLSLIENERACHKYQSNITGKIHIIHRYFIYFHTTFMHNPDVMCSLIVFNQNRWVSSSFMLETHVLLNNKFVVSCLATKIFSATSAPFDKFKVQNNDFFQGKWTYLAKFRRYNLFYPLKNTHRSKRLNQLYM